MKRPDTTSSLSPRLSLGAGGDGLDRRGEGETEVAPGVGKSGGGIAGSGSGRGGTSGVFFLSMEAGGVMKTEEKVDGFLSGVSAEPAIAFRARRSSRREGAASSALIRDGESERERRSTRAPAASPLQIFPPTFKFTVDL